MGDHENILGTLVIGVFFNTFLYGIVTIQYLSFIARKFEDTRTIQLGVFLLFFNDTVQSAAMMYMIWVYLVQNFGATSFMHEVIWAYAYIPIGTAITVVTTHLVMSYRIYRMSKSKCLFAILVSGALGTFSVGITFGVQAFSLTTIMTHANLKMIVAAWLGTQAIMDVLIAMILAVFLHLQRVGGDSKMDSVINRLIRGAIQAGILPLTFAIAGLAAFLIRPNTNLYIMFVIPIGRTYTTSILDGLNVRDTLKEKLLGSSEINVVVSQVIWRNPSRLSGPRTPGLAPVESKEQEIDSPQTTETEASHFSADSTTPILNKQLSSPMQAHTRDYKAKWMDCPASAGGIML